VTCTHYIKCVCAKLGLYVLSVCSKSFARPTRKQVTFRCGTVGHLYIICEETGRDVGVAEANWLHLRSAFCKYNM